MMDKNYRTEYFNNKIKLFNMKIFIHAMKLLNFLLVK